MKLIVLLFFVGYAAAIPSLYEVMEDAAEEIYHDFLVGMQDAPSLKRHLGLGEDHFLADETENDIKTELGKRLRESLDHILEKIKESIEQGKVVKEDLQNKLKEIKDKMNDLRIDLGGRAKELLEKIKEKSKEFLRNLLDKLGLKEKDIKRSVGDEDLARFDINLKDLFRKLKKEILSNINKEKLKENVEKLFGKGSEMADALEKIINEKGDKYKQKILDFIDRFLGKDEKSFMDTQDSIAEYWDKIKDFFKDLKIDLKEKYAKFGEWVKEVYKKGIDKSKSKIENVREIAKEFLDHAKGISKEVAVEALEFLRPYHEDLGSLYDQVKETVKDILKRQDAPQDSIAEYWDKIKDFFKDLKIDLKEKYAKFGEWVKDAYKKGIDKSKSKIENVREIAKEFIDHAKGISREVAVEALDFLTPYHKDLGSLYDQVVETVKDILKKNN